MHDLFTCLERLHPITPELKSYLSRVMKPISFPKHKYLLKEGEISNKIWFLEKGLVRCFLNRDDREVTMWFINEGHAVSDLQSLFNQSPGEYYLETLENSITWHVEHKDLQYILQHFSEASSIRIKISDWYTGLLNLRLRCTSMQTPKDRYHYFLQHFSYLNKRITLDIIASYLDISKRTLIRVMHP